MDNTTTTTTTSTTTTADEESQLVAANDDIARTLIPAQIYLVVLMVLGIVGNLLVCFVFLFRLRMSTQDRLIIALAVFDLLSCFIAMPTEIVDIRNYLMFDNEFACRLLRFIIHYCAFASILTLIVIAIDRYMKVCRPLHRQISLKHIKGALVVILSVALLLALPAFVVYGIRTTEVEGLTIHGHDCSTNDHVMDTVYPLVYSSVLFAAFFLVLGTLAVIYVRIWREIKRHRIYMARNSVCVSSTTMATVAGGYGGDGGDGGGGDSRLYLSSVSEVSSAGECPSSADAAGRRCGCCCSSSLETPSPPPPPPPPPQFDIDDEECGGNDNDDDDVFAAGRCRGMPEHRGASSGRAVTHFASIDIGADDSTMQSSARSNTTLCDADPDPVLQQHGHPPEPEAESDRGEGMGSATVPADNPSRVMEDSKKPRPQLEGKVIRPDVGGDEDDDDDEDALCSKRLEFAVVGNGVAFPPAKPLGTARPVAGGTREEGTPTPHPVFFYSALSSSVGVSVARESEEARGGSGLKTGRMRDATDTDSQQCLRESVDDKMHDASTGRNDQIHDASTGRNDKKHDASTGKNDQNHDGSRPTGRNDKIHDGSTGRNNQIHDASAGRNDQIHDASTGRIDKKRDVSTGKNDQNHDTSTGKDNQIHDASINNFRNGWEESIDDNSNLTKTSAMLAAVSQTDLADSTRRNEQACIIAGAGRERREGHVEEGDCDTHADAADSSVAPGWRGPSAPEICRTCVAGTGVSAAAHPLSIPPSPESSGARAVPTSRPSDVRTTADFLCYEGNGETSPSRSSETERDCCANLGTSHKTVDTTQRRPSNADTVPGHWVETDRERTNVCNALKTVDTTPRRPSTTKTDRENKSSARETEATPKRSSRTETDRTDARHCSKTAAATPKRSTERETGGTNANHSLPTAAARTTAAIAAAAAATVTATAAAKRRVTQKASSSVSEVKSHKTTVIATSVTVVFFLSFVPHLSLITVRTVNTQFDQNLEGAGLVLYNIFLRSYFINSVTNPFIYGLLNARFRAECLRVLRYVVACRKRFT